MRRLMQASDGTVHKTLACSIVRFLTRPLILQQGDDPNVGGIVLSVFEGVLYTVLEALPGAGPVLGNIMEAGINHAA